MEGEACDRFEKCGTCAFRAGTEASESPFTLLKARLSAENGEPFYCHEPMETLMKAEPGLPLSEAIDYLRGEGEMRLCGGAARLMDRLAAQGHFERDEEWRQLVRRALLELIHRAETEPGFDLDETAFRQMLEATIEKEAAAHA